MGERGYVNQQEMMIVNSLSETQPCALLSGTVLRCLRSRLTRNHRAAPPFTAECTGKALGDACDQAGTDNTCCSGACASFFIDEGIVNLCESPVTGKAGCPSNPVTPNFVSGH